MKHSHEFSNEFFWLANRRQIIFLNIHRTFFQNIEGEREREEEGYIYEMTVAKKILLVPYLVQIPYIHISPAIVNFSIANFHDRALTVIS